VASAYVHLQPDITSSLHGQLASKRPTASALRVAGLTKLTTFLRGRLQFLGMLPAKVQLQLAGAFPRTITEGECLELAIRDTSPVGSLCSFLHFVPCVF
jgi:hypothetical protein